MSSNAITVIYLRKKFQVVLFVDQSERGKLSTTHSLVRYATFVCISPLPHHHPMPRLVFSRLGLARKPGHRPSFPWLRLEIF